MGFHYVGQAPDLQCSAHLSLPECWRYKPEPVCSASYCVYDLVYSLALNLPASQNIDIKIIVYQERFHN